MRNPVPAFAVCGYSGSGKTTVIEQLIRQLTARGLKVGIIKHDVHGINIDREGKDTDRFFKAGADVTIRGPEQCFFRAHRRGDIPLEDVIRLLGPYYDLILIEGFKSTPLEQKVWLCSDDGEGPPPEAGPVKRVLKREEDRVGIVGDMIDEWLPSAWRSTPVYAGILIGGKSTRLGRPKHLLPVDGRTWLERTIETAAPYVDDVVILGKGEVPDALSSVTALSDTRDAQGPLSGMRAATRWSPGASWLFLPCDMPGLSAEAIAWLLEERRPCAWAILPQLCGAPGPEPLFAFYDFRAAPYLERVSRPIEVAAEDHVISPEVPTSLEGAWKNVNTPQDLNALGL